MIAALVIGGVAGAVFLGYWICRVREKKRMAAFERWLEENRP